ncbi:protein ABHD12B isoform X4 [Pan paniscus]|uniref:protein ABHD12B isoform X4 n=1 Tax=Pan paniscus TaxID=9597 RepID=UPI00155FB42D|nr:protein ABHD12B isoform X5 [Pan paniscus]
MVKTYFTALCAPHTRTHTQKYNGNQFKIKCCIASYKLRTSVCVCVAANSLTRAERTLGPRLPRRTSLPDRAEEEGGRDAAGAGRSRAAAPDCSSRGGGGVSGHGAGWTRRTARRPHRPSRPGPQPVAAWPPGGTWSTATCVKAPFLVDLKKPELKIPHTVNFYLRVEPGVMLGIWHTVPSCRGEDAKGKDCCWYEAALRDGNPIIVYLHGSAEHRAASHRLKLVKVLSDGGFHVLSVDYRGFGDSTGKPTEEGLTTDAICVYEWTKARSGITPVCLWGHSLGTGVATNAAKVLEEKGCPVDAIVLEAPFTNMWVASINYPLLKVYAQMA